MSNIRMSRCARIVIVLYSIVLLMIPISNLHVEGLLLPFSYVVSDNYYHETDLLILIHEILFVHLSDLTDYLYRSVELSIDHFIVCVSDKNCLDHTNGIPCLLSSALLPCFIYTLRRYSVKRKKTLPQTEFSFRLFEHSPPFSIF